MNVAEEKLIRVIDHNLDVIAALIGSVLKDDRGRNLGKIKSLDELLKDTDALNRTINATDASEIAEWLSMTKHIVRRHACGKHVFLDSCKVGMTDQLVDMNLHLKENS